MIADLCTVTIKPLFEFVLPRHITEVLPLAVKLLSKLKLDALSSRFWVVVTRSVPVRVTTVGTSTLTGQRTVQVSEALHGCTKRQKIVSANNVARSVLLFIYLVSVL